jgi:hypothetical protein
VRPAIWSFVAFKRARAVAGRVERRHRQKGARAATIDDDAYSVPHPPPVGVTISIASPASTLVSAQPGRISMLPSLRRTEFRPAGPNSRLRSNVGTMQDRLPWPLDPPEGDGRHCRLDPPLLHCLELRTPAFDRELTGDKPSVVCNG